MKAAWAAAFVAVSMLAAAAPSAAQPLIFGGGPASINEFPFAATVYSDQTACAGSIIGPRHVLTAAHCIREPASSYKVVTGRTDLEDGATGQTIPVIQTFVSSDFRDGQGYRGHDLAVVALQAPTASPAAVLATGAQGKAATKAGKVLRVAGWGSTTKSQGSPSFNQLKAATIRALAPKRCKKYGKAFRGGVMVCSTGAKLGRGKRSPRVSTCQGDSGAGYIAVTPDGPRLVGLDSFGSLKCGSPTQPTVFAKTFDPYGLSFIGTAISTPLP